MMLIMTIGIVGSGIAMSMGSSYGTAEGAWTAWTVLCAIIVPLCAGGMIAEKRKEKLLEADLKVHHQHTDELTKRYNRQIDQLVREHREEYSNNLNKYLENDWLLSTYNKKYQSLEDKYKLEKEVLESAFDDAHPQHRHMKRLWQAIIVFGFIAQLVACGYSMGAIAEEEPLTSPPTHSTAPQASNTEVTYWNAENIPIPYLTDSTRYVSNPEQVVSTATEQQLNQWLQRYNDSLSIETVMILVNHIENDDPFRMAQDVGNKYGVGRGDRGLIVILGYEDHSLNISPGRSLEADLTDVECHRLEQQYAVPFLKVNQPDSAMLYLTTAMYSRLLSKDMPVIAKTAQTDDSPEDALFTLYFLFFVAWCIFLAYLAHHYRLLSTVKLKDNPFVKQAASNGFVVFDSPSHGRGGFGGGFGGGSFGGGSFGGGGATSRW